MPLRHNVDGDGHTHGDHWSDVPDGSYDPNSPGRRAARAMIEQNSRRERTSPQRIIAYLLALLMCFSILSVIVKGPRYVPFPGFQLGPHGFPFERGFDHGRPARPLDYMPEHPRHNPWQHPDRY